MTIRPGRNRLFRKSEFFNDFLLLAAAIHGPLQRALVHLSREMDGALAVHGVPSRGIGTAKELSFQADADGRFLPIHSHDGCSRVPSGAARCAANHPERLDASRSIQFHLEIGGPEELPVPAQADLPGQAASGGRRDGLGDFQLLARSDDGNGTTGTPFG